MLKVAGLDLVVYAGKKVKLVNNKSENIIVKGGTILLGYGRVTYKKAIPQLHLNGFHTITRSAEHDFVKSTSVRSTMLIVMQLCLIMLL